MCPCYLFRSKAATSEQSYFMGQGIHIKKNLNLPNDHSQLGSGQEKQGDWDAVIFQVYQSFYKSTLNIC